MIQFLWRFLSAKVCSSHMYVDIMLFIWLWGTFLWILWDWWSFLNISYPLKCGMTFWILFVSNFSNITMLHLFPNWYYCFATRSKSGKTFLIKKVRVRKVLIIWRLHSVIILHWDADYFQPSSPVNCCQVYGNKIDLEITRERGLF